MKAVMKVRKNVSKVARGWGAKAKVLAGKKEKTPGGLLAGDLCRNKWGHVVSKKRSASSKKNSWMKATA
eukprot:CAMPEP_0172758522 /NCGR_PEP_ID=MMETSP1074-20121228/165898_1 /TAXON_ID=2916 /ORGANISM="Ceratium fusus, Strain PA161109" /LENGTH=68 /DNA_ID=CAMNT_0013592137 /DNA_START=51 /DNA_END=253 /DNA_ORIENTATION=+